MKKYDLLKVLGITFAIIVLISWVIPAGIYSDGSFTSLEMTNPIGLFDLVNIPLLIFNNFIEFGLLLLAIGGLYGVLNTTGVYSKLVETVTNKWKKNSKKFLIVTTVISGSDNFSPRYLTKDIKYSTIGNAFCEYSNLLM